MFSVSLKHKCSNWEGPAWSYDIAKADGARVKVETKENVEIAFIIQSPV
jgi:hypothetical protein